MSSFDCSSVLLVHQLFLQRIASKQNQIDSKTSDWRNVALGNPDEEATNTEDQDDIEVFFFFKAFCVHDFKNICRG